MTSPDRIAIAVGLLLDSALRALADDDWGAVLQRTEVALTLDPGNAEAERLRAAATVATDASRRLSRSAVSGPPDSASHPAVATLEEVVAEVAELVPFPAVAARIIEHIDDETGTIDALARLISTDPTLTARLLSVANSAYYGRRQTVGTVREAIVLLGAAEVRSLALTTCVIDAARAPSVVNKADYWRFVITVALLSDLLARVGGSLRGEAFTAGLLHKIGLLALDLYSPDGLRRAVQLKLVAQPRLHDREQEVFGFTDAELGAALAREWRLPEPIVEAIAKHGARPDELGRDDFLASCVVRARVLARSHGMSDGVERGPQRSPPTEWTEPPLRNALERLGGVDGLVQRVNALLEQSL